VNREIVEKAIMEGGVVKIDFRDVRHFTTLDHKVSRYRGEDVRIAFGFSFTQPLRAAVYHSPSDQIWIVPTEEIET
jgi:hypothetical protein